MKMIALVLLILLAWLQYKIWLQDGGIPEVLQLEDEVVELQQDVMHGRIASNCNIFNIIPGKPQVGLSLLGGLHPFCRTFVALILFYLFFGRVG